MVTMSGLLILLLVGLMVIVSLERLELQVPTRMATGRSLAAHSALVGSAEP